MKVMIQGFEWELGAVSVGDFFAFLDSDICGEEFKGSGQKRILYSCELKPYQCGILITKSDRRTRLELGEDAAGNYIVQIRQNAENASPMELNEGVRE